MTFGEMKMQELFAVNSDSQDLVGFIYVYEE